MIEKLGHWNRAGSSTRLIVGKWAVASVYYSACRAKDDPAKYAAVCLLPGLRTELGSFVSEQEAQVTAQAAVWYWLDRAGLDVREQTA